MPRTKVARLLVFVIPLVAFENFGLPAIALLWGEPYWKGVVFAMGFWWILLGVFASLAAFVGLCRGFLYIAEWIGQGE